MISHRLDQAAGHMDSNCQTAMGVYRITSSRGGVVGAPIAIIVSSSKRAGSVS